MEQGFANFEAWRDDVLQQEELERHKLDRKIVREDQWMHGGVTARRKRNVRRVRELRDMTGSSCRHQMRFSIRIRLSRWCQLAFSPIIPPSLACHS